METWGRQIMTDMCIWGRDFEHHHLAEAGRRLWKGQGRGVFSVGWRWAAFFFSFFFLSLGVNIESTNFKLCPTLVPKSVLITCEQNINSVFFDNLYQERLFIQNFNSNTQDSFTPIRIKKMSVCKSTHYLYHLDKTFLIILIWPSHLLSIEVNVLDNYVILLIWWIPITG